MHNRFFRTLPVIALSLTALAGCKPTTVTAGEINDPTAQEVKSAPPVKLPPAMLASKDYRCKDNTLVHVDWFNDGTSATFRPKKGADPVALTAPAAGQPYASGDLVVTGSADAKSITVAKGHASQVCDA